MNPVIYPTIEYLKSALSINTAIGCSLGCEYCVVGELTKKSPQRVSSPREVIGNLTQNRLFIPNETPLTINNKTDPFFGYVKEDTFEILRLLQERGLKNPRIIISKLPLAKRDLEYLEGLNEPVFFITSYSHLGYPIEKSNSERQLTSFRTLINRGRVKSLHYWRPLIKGLNDDEESIRKVLENVSKSCDASILSGLRVTPGIEARIKKYGADLRGWNGDRAHKYLPPDIQERIIQIKNELFPTYPLFRHTSCALSALTGESDYGFNFLRGPPHCIEGCMNSCCLGFPPSESRVQELFKQLGIEQDYSIEEREIYVKGELTQEEKSFLSYGLRFPVRALKIKKSLSEILLTQ